MRSTQLVMSGIVTLALCVAIATPVLAEKVVHPNAGEPGEWRLIGRVQADHSADHDKIIVQGPFDNFRKIKLAPLPKL